MTTTRITSIRAAMIGTGFMAAVHGEALRRLGVDVLGAAGSSPERAAAHALAENLPVAYASVAELLADERVDVVHVTSPNHLHHEHALAALRAGKHVVCEKPLATTSAQSAELLAAARASGRVHAVNFMARFYAQCQEARARVLGGGLGDVHLVSGSYLQDWLLYPTDWNWRVDREQGGALRAVGDIGSHWLDLVTFVSGRRVSETMADLRTVHPVRLRPGGRGGTFAAAGGDGEPRAVETEDAAGVLLRFEGGMRGVATISQVSPGRKNQLAFELDGGAGSLAWNSERPEELWQGARDEPNRLLLRDPALMTPAGAAASDYPGGHAQGFPDAFKALYRAVYRAVADGGPPEEPDYPTFADGHEQLLVAEAIAASASSGRWTAVRRDAPAEAAPRPSNTTIKDPA
ncbi:Gfo/Idh/MocA family oxidoreductase [Conexibacter sp. JD483]|uniref:Gfo/Idh/MocA family protein n=1 Tax=unclassified Conexibacter TaxID=2627773 RepID=UPI0027251146|nr:MULTISPECIES: Gfo/Idh/MocA family oxidoreductase [unclassified Conexibacter]MDO8188326.1 Gfo/Idh/MocA family oxidoreductase [Conexibacter sp. CPCC 205706]MDO8200726.1 Gfo/Idh/MocA family oxidoreductase [Conexibacter sp. CPCC 205762]MDR9369450.1 Gfo/Idh/MocA family oxidoreductase [Conexibacter sp. JD483]